MFRSLAHLPVDYRFLTTPLPEEEDTRRSQMNFSRHCAYSESRLLDLASASQESLSLATTERESLHWFSSATLCNLLSLSSIVSPGGKESPHYVTLKQQLGAQKILPPPSRCDAIAEGMHLPWTALYGSLGYYLSLRSEPLSYATPSLMVREAILILLGITSTRAGRDLSRLLLLINDPSPEADWLLYTYHVDFLRALPPEQIFPSLIAFIQVLPPLLDWYLSFYRSGVMREPLPPTGAANDLIGYNLLLNICRAVIRSGLDWSPSFTYDYVHQALPWEVYELYKTLINLISTTRYQRGLSMYDMYLSPLMEVISPMTPTEALSEGANQLLLSFPPGGYNLLLILLSSELVNRVHILSEDSSTYISERVRGLLHLASLLLRKSNLPHVRATGWNLSLAARSPYTEPQITDLFLI